MKKLPTALEFIEDMQSELGEQEYIMLYKIDVPKKMIEFVKLHLKAQQDAILKILDARGEHNNFKKNIIVNAYPLTNIL